MSRGIRTTVLAAPVSLFATAPSSRTAASSNNTEMVVVTGTVQTPCANTENDLGPLDQSQMLSSQVLLSQLVPGGCL